MTVSMIIGLILLPFAWALIAAANKVYRDEHGVNGPSRTAWKNIRRRARKLGISEHEAHAQWITRKQNSSGKYLLGVTDIVEPVLVRPATPLWEREPERSQKVIKPRPPKHEPIRFELLVTMAAIHGWVIKKHAYGYSIYGREKQPLENPYAANDAISTDFTYEDVEDFLLSV